MFKLYTVPGTCALAVHLVLEETGAPYEVQWLDFSANAQRSPGYLAINPKGRVPALETPQGVLTETPALLVYLGQVLPEAGLLPADAFGLAQLQAFNSYLASTVHIAHAHGRRGARWVDADDTASIEAMRRKVPVSMADAYQLIEDGLLTGPWVMGEQYTVADAYLFTLSQWLPGDGVDPSRFPRVAEHTRRMNERPAVQRVLASVGQVAR